MALLRLAKNRVFLTGTKKKIMCLCQKRVFWLALGQNREKNHVSGMCQRANLSGIGQKNHVSSVCQDVSENTSKHIPNTRFLKSMCQDFGHVCPLVHLNPETLGLSPYSALSTETKNAMCYDVIIKKHTARIYGKEICPS